MEAIVCTNIWKKYRLRDGYRISFKERLLGRKTFRAPGDDEDEFWALKDVSFSVREGEGVGILGKNGAGKSTLLRIMASILVPTRGEVSVRGNFCPVLSLGVGFHPEFTGEENVFMAAAVLGKGRKEVEACFEDILDFSELGDFIEAPLKFYSSGMLARLAFATALHMDADTFLIDEALAVGDLGFQNKCVEKLLELKSAGKTFVIVSHNPEFLRPLCEKGILIHEHKLFAKRDLDSVIRTYVEIIEEEYQVRKESEEIER